MDLAVLGPPLLVALLGAVVGTVMGLTGAGGTLLALPLLTLVLGLSLPEAVPVSLLAVAVGAGIGAWNGLRAGLVRWRAALLIAAAGGLLAPLGLGLGARLPLPLLGALFAGVLLLAAGRQFLAAWRSRRGAWVPPEAVQLPPLCPLHPETGRFHWTPRTVTLLAGLGALTGLLSGLLGVGGGFLVLPALLRLSRLGYAVAVATTLAVLAVIAGTTLSLAIAAGRAPPLALALPFTLGLVPALLLGQRWALSLSPLRVQLLFAALLCGVAAQLIYDVLRH